jgi:hypothetical protein
LPPPAKVLAVVDVSDSTIVDVSGLTVRFVDVAQFHTVPVPDNVQVPLPIVIVLALVLELENVVHDKLLLFKFSVPLVKVVMPLIEALSANCNVPPIPLFVIGLIVLPADVIVCVPDIAINDITPAPAVTVVPASRVKLPLLDIALTPWDHVPVNPVKSSDNTVPIIDTVSVAVVLNET